MTQHPYSDDVIDDATKHMIHWTRYESQSGIPKCPQKPLMFTKAGCRIDTWVMRTLHFSTFVGQMPLLATMPKKLCSS